MSDLHYDYAKGALNETDLTEHPHELLERWIAAARSHQVVEPTAMCLSTATPQGIPSARMVLCRGLSAEGVTFYTNYGSRKGLELEENPVAAITFWWGELERQVRVEGRVQRVSEEESDQYFTSRPLGSRIASIASPQSREVASREELMMQLEEVTQTAGPEPARPSHWGGFRLLPTRFEFWQGRPARLHDRIVYDREVEGWKIRRLAP